MFNTILWCFNIIAVAIVIALRHVRVLPQKFQFGDFSSLE